MIAPATRAETPRWSREAEMSVLGGMLLDADARTLAAELLAESDFYRDGHRRLFRAILALMGRGEVIDPVTLVTQLKDTGDLDTVGGIGFLTELEDAVPTAANLEYHAGIVRRMAGLRAVQAAAAGIAEVVRDAGTLTAEEVHDAAVRIVAESAPALRGTPTTPVRELMWPVLERFERLGTDREERGIPTGVRAFDDLTGGFRRGDLVVIAGRPSMGKSAFCVCNAVAHAAVFEKLTTALFTVETSSEDATQRILASLARVDVAKARRRHRLLDEEFPRLEQATNLLSPAPLFIDDRARTVEQIRGKLKRLVRERGKVDVIAVDYLQMLEAPQYAGNRLQEVSYLSRELKKIAMEFHAVMIALAQLSRAVEQRPDKRPMMSDLRESGAIEADADVVALLYRPEYYHGPTMSVGKGKNSHQVNVEGKAEIILGKVRDGSTGTAHVEFVKEYTLFQDPEGYRG